MPDPIYRTIAEDLRRQIETGELRPGQQLGTEIELRDHYNASRNTIRDAIKLLITRGLVETRPGQGTFVVETIVPFVTTLTGAPETASGGEGDTYTKEVAARLRVPKATPLEVGIHEAGSPAAPAVGELQLPDGSPVVSRHQQRYIDDIPWSLQTSFYPMSLAQKAIKLIQAGNIEEGTVQYLKQELRIKQAGYRDTITVRAPDNVEAAFFKLPDDGRISIIETRRTGFDEQGIPFRLTVSVYPADRNQFALNVGEVPAKVADPPSAAGSKPDAESGTSTEEEAAEQTG
jgi:GntR family transcriptional regulator